MSNLNSFRGSGTRALDKGRFTLPTEYNPIIKNLENKIVLAFPNENYAFHFNESIPYLFIPQDFVQNPIDLQNQYPIITQIRIDEIQSSKYSRFRIPIPEDIRNDMKTCDKICYIGEGNCFTLMNQATYASVLPQKIPNPDNL